MATKHKDPVPAMNKEIKRGALPIGSGSTHRIRPRPSSPSGTSVAKDHSKTQGPPKSSTTAGDHLSKHFPNYLKPTASSKTDVGVGKPGVGKKQHLNDHDMHKPNPITAVRRRSFDKPVPASQVHKAVHQSSSSARVVAKPNASISSERVSKVVKAVKSQPPLVKTKSLPKGFASSSKKEVATTMNKASELTSNVVVTSEAEEESLDVNVEEELAKLESPVGPHLEHDHVVDEEENHSSLAAAAAAAAQYEYVDDHANQEKHNSADHEKHDEEEPVAEDVKVHNEETRDQVQESQNVDEIINQQTANGATNKASTEDDNKNEKEELDNIMKADAGVGLTHVKTTSPNEVGAEGEEEEVSMQGEEEKESAKSEPAISVVHKRQIGGPMNKKESPAYNDVIEETASKLVEKRVNKVRALAGAFETVISLEQPHSS